MAVLSADVPTLVAMETEARSPNDFPTMNFGSNVFVVEENAGSMANRSSPTTPRIFSSTPPLYRPEGDGGRGGGPHGPFLPRQRLRRDPQRQEGNDIVLPQRRVGEQVDLVFLERAGHSDGHGHVPFLRLRPHVEARVVPSGILEIDRRALDLVLVPAELHRPLDDVERSEDDHPGGVADDPELPLRDGVGEVVPDPDRAVRDRVDVEADAEGGLLPPRGDIEQPLAEIDQHLFGAQGLRVAGRLHLDVAGDQQVVHRPEKFRVPLDDRTKFLRVRIPHVEEIHREVKALPRVHLERDLSPSVDVAAPALRLEMFENDLFAADDRIRPDPLEELVVSDEREGAAFQVPCPHDRGGVPFPGDPGFEGHRTVEAVEHGRNGKPDRRRRQLPFHADVQGLRPRRPSRRSGRGSPRRRSSRRSTGPPPDPSGRKGPSPRVRTLRPDS